MQRIDIGKSTQSYSMIGNNYESKIKAGRLLFVTTTPLDATSSMLLQSTYNAGGRFDTFNITQIGSQTNAREERIGVTLPNPFPPSSHSRIY